MNADYSKLARRRVETVWEPYLQPEDFGYDFREWVSPYTKSAHATDSIAIVLQDWASADGISDGFEPEIQKHGRKPNLATNKRLDTVLHRVLGLSIGDVYVTNAFPFIKPGGMSSNLTLRDVTKAVSSFAAQELELAKPKMILALGSLTAKALKRAGVDATHLPHPMIRGTSLDAYEEIWRSTLQRQHSEAKASVAELKLLVRASSND